MSDLPLEQALVRSLQATFGDIRWTVIDLLQAAAAEAPDRAAILEPDRASLSYAELLELVEDSVKTLNGMGFRRNSNIALALPTSPEAAVAYLAVMVSMTAIALSPTESVAHYVSMLAHMRAEALLVAVGDSTEARAAAAQLGIPVIEMEPLNDGPSGRFRLVGLTSVPAAIPEFSQPDDKIIVIATSGTTSLPRFVSWTQRKVVLGIYTLLTPFLNTVGPRLNMLPLHHGAGANAILAAVAAKKGFVCLRSYDATTIYRYLALYSAESLQVVPALLSMLVAEAPAHQAEIAQLRIKVIYVGSARVSELLLQNIQRIFGAAVNISYGMSETGPITRQRLTSTDSGEYRAGLVGKPLPICQVRIVGEHGEPLPPLEDGQIVVFSPLTASGYENNPEASDAQFRDGWFSTGDIGYLDAEGSLYLTGRIKEVINRGGSKISPTEVEAVMQQHPAVVEAAAFGFPHTALGEDIAVAIVLKDRKVSERELRLFAGRQLPLGKVPSRFVFVPELPRTSVGKIRRNVLTEQFRDMLER